MSTPYLDPLVEALKVPGPERTREQLQPIIDFVRGLKIFSSFSTMHPETLSQIASKLETEYHIQGSYVFVEGQSGHKFFIVLEGEVSIIRKRAMLKTKGSIGDQLRGAKTETTVLAKLGCGRYFGENALDSKDGLRTATAMTSQRTRLLSLDAEDYQNILSQFKEKIKEDIKRFIMSPTSLFCNLHSEQIRQLINYAIIRTYSVNDEIVRAGDKVQQLVMIKSGIVRLTKSLRDSELESTLKISDKRMYDKRAETAKAARRPPEGKVDFESEMETLLHVGPDDFDGNPSGFWLVQRYENDSGAINPFKETEHHHGNNHRSNHSSPKAAPAADKGRVSAIAAGHKRDARHSMVAVATTQNFSLSRNASNSDVKQVVRAPSLRGMMSRGNSMSPEGGGGRGKGLGNSGVISVSPLASRVNSIKLQGSSDDEHPPPHHAQPKSQQLSLLKSGGSFRKSFRKLEAEYRKSWLTSERQVNMSDAPAHGLATYSEDTSASNNDDDSSQPSLDLSIASPREQVENFTVAVLMSGEVFGELAVIAPNSRSPVSVFASTAVEAYSFDAKLLSSIGIRDNEQIMKILKEDWKFRNPPTAEIQKRVGCKYEWETDKAKMLKALRSKPSRAKPKLF